MKWDRTPAFDRDLRRLTNEELRLFRKVVGEEFAPAADRIASDASANWPAGLRVKPVAAARGIWDLTWSFSGPDGRATFEWVQIDGGRALRWRRVGSHNIFKDPAR